jgi:hypothetical protein
MLALGIALAALGLIHSDTGLGPIWWVLMGILVFPAGTLGGVVFWVLLSKLSGMIWGDGWHFSPVAEVCLTWLAMIYFGNLQWTKFLQWRSAETHADSRTEH